MDSYDYGRTGDSNYWRICVNLATLPTTITNLVTPEAVHEGPPTIGGQASVFRDPGIVLRGFAYSFTGAAGVGFDLVFRNNQGNTSSDETQWAARTGSDGICQFASGDIVWPLRRPVETAPGTYVAGILAALRSGAITDGYLQIWGTHGVGDYYGLHAYGSPSTQY